MVYNGQLQSKKLMFLCRCHDSENLQIFHGGDDLRPSSEPLPGFSALDAERPTRPPRMSAPPGAAPGAAGAGARARLAATERPMEEAYVTWKNGGVYGRNGE